MTGSCTPLQLFVVELLVLVDVVLDDDVVVRVVIDVVILTAYTSVDMGALYSDPPKASLSVGAPLTASRILLALTGVTSNALKCATQVMAPSPGTVQGKAQSVCEMLLAATSARSTIACETLPSNSVVNASATGQLNGMNPSLCRVAAWRRAARACRDRDRARAVLVPAMLTAKTGTSVTSGREKTVFPLSQKFLQYGARPDENNKNPGLHEPHSLFARRSASGFRSPPGQSPAKSVHTRTPDLSGASY